MSIRDIIKEEVKNNQFVQVKARFPAQLHADLEAAYISLGIKNLSQALMVASKGLIEEAKRQMEPKKRSKTG
jgi:hypothetical protein